MSTQIERNAQMVADLAISDWRMAYVIACSVRVSEHGGARRGSSGHADLKVSTNEFARMVKKAAGGRVYGVGPDGIRSTLNRWDSLVADGYVWNRDELKPADANDEVEFPDWSFRAETTRGADENLASIKRSTKRIAEALEDPEVAAKVAASASPKAKRNIAAATVDQQTLDDPKVKMKVRSQVAQHDDTARKSSSGKGDEGFSGLSDTISSGIGMLGNPHLDKAVDHFRAFKRDVDSGDWIVSDADMLSLSVLIDLTSEVAMGRDFSDFNEEVK